jgi:DNA-binding NarL/FixJ family response regulator
MKTRITIFDDNAKRRDGLMMLIDSMEDMECCGTFNDCREVLKNIDDTKPNVVLMDIDMPHVNGIEGVLLIREKYPDLKILMQTVFEDDDKIFAAVCAGANGYILKQANPLKLIEAISEVLQGGAPMTPVIANKVLMLFNKQNSIYKKQTFDLTKRELEILELLVKGYSYKMIADQCNISYPTVNTHITKIYQKLHVQSSAGAVSVAIREGLVK